MPESTTPSARSALGFGTCRPAAPRRTHGFPSASRPRHRGQRVAGADRLRGPSQPCAGSELYIEPWNASSIQVAEAAGYQREGLLHGHQEIGGARRDMLLYATTDLSAEQGAGQHMKRIGLLGGMSWESSPSTTGAGHCGAAGHGLHHGAWDFCVGRLECTHGLAVVVRDAEDRRLVHDVIYQELCLGIVKEDSRQAYRRVIGDLVDRGAEGICSAARSTC